MSISLTDPLSSRTLLLFSFSPIFITVLEMAFMAGARYLKGMPNQVKGRRCFATAASSADHKYNKFSLTGEFAPVAVLGGFLAIVVTMAAHTGYQQLRHSPTVSPTKRRRRMISEVDRPDSVVASADKFINSSFLRHVSQIQDKSKAVIPDTIRPNPFTRPRNAETLKDVGVLG